MLNYKNIEIEYKNVEELNNKKKEIVNIFKIYSGSFYIKKIKKNNKKLLVFCGIFNDNILKDIIKQLKKIFDKIYIKKDSMFEYFKDESKYIIYRDTSIKFDEIFADYYFCKKINNGDIYIFIINIYKYFYKLKKMSISHWSHFWGFFMKDDIVDKEKLYEYIKKNQIKKISTDFFYKDAIFLANELYNNLLKELKKDDKFNIYYPRDIKVLLNNGKISSKLHKNTLEYINENVDIKRDIDYLFNIWFLNILYEKMILLEITILDKYIINYSISKFCEYNLDKSINEYIKNKKEVIFINE